MSGPPKPTPPQRAFTVYDLRHRVSAKDKVLASRGTLEHGAQIIQDNYGADHRSSMAFAAWLRGEEYELQPAVEDNSGVERRHTGYDPQTGDPRSVDTKPGSIPPEPC